MFCKYSIFTRREKIINELAEEGTGSCFMGIFQKNSTNSIQNTKTNQRGNRWVCFADSLLLNGIHQSNVKGKKYLSFGMILANLLVHL